MEILTLPLGMLSANCYIVSEGEDCVLIDPGAQPEMLDDFLKQHHKTPRAVLLTHGHFDHVGAVEAFRELPVYLHPGDTTLDSRYAKGLYWNRTYEDGDELTFGDLQFRVLHTPGHTPGSVCLVSEAAMFSGDTLFAGCCGRTDMPGGNWEEMIGSLRKL